MTLACVDDITAYCDNNAIYKGTVHQLVQLSRFAKFGKIMNMSLKSDYASEAVSQILTLEARRRSKPCMAAEQTPGSTTNLFKVLHCKVTRAMLAVMHACIRMWLCVHACKSTDWYAAWMTLSFSLADIMFSKTFVMPNSDHQPCLM